MDYLERYYNEYLSDYAEASNYEDYDVDMQMTRDRIEKILERGYIEKGDVGFLQSLLPEIESVVIREGLERVEILS